MLANPGMNLRQYETIPRYDRSSEIFLGTDQSRNALTSLPGPQFHLLTVHTQGKKLVSEIDYILCHATSDLPASIAQTLLPID